MWTAWPVRHGIRTDGSALEQLTADEDDIDPYSPSPSPDGARFAYVIRYPGRISNSHFIAVRDVVTGTVDTITATVESSSPLFAWYERQATVSWAPDGGWIAYTTPGHAWYFSMRSWMYGSYVQLVRPDRSDLARLVAGRLGVPGGVNLPIPPTRGAKWKIRHPGRRARRAASAHVEVVRCDDVPDPLVRLSRHRTPSGHQAGPHGASGPPAAARRQA